MTFVNVVSKCKNQKISPVEAAKIIFNKSKSVGIHIY